jgi:hypothetical protein
MEEKINTIEGTIIVELLSYDSFKDTSKLQLVSKDGKETRIKFGDMPKYFTDHPNQGIVLKSNTPNIKEGDKVAITGMGVGNGVNDPFLFNGKVYIRIYRNDVLWIYDKA